jgi:hypothetical protein
MKSMADAEALFSGSARQTTTPLRTPTKRAGSQQRDHERRMLFDRAGVFPGIGEVAAGSTGAGTGWSG